MPLIEFGMVCNYKLVVHMGVCMHVLPKPQIFHFKTSISSYVTVFFFFMDKQMHYLLFLILTRALPCYLFNETSFKFLTQVYS